MEELKFITHTKEVITGERLQKALNRVANDMIELAHAIREENAYASHVTEEVKIRDFEKYLEYAKEVRNGNINNFTIWQRVNTVLTGECIGLLK